MFAGRFNFYHGILRDDATIIFDLDVELIAWQDAPAELKNFRETIRAEPVLDIAADVRLKHDRFAPAGDTTAVDEVLHEMTHLGHVGMGRNEISIGQDETRKRVGMLFEDLSKSGEFHKRSIFLFRNIIKRPRKRMAFMVEGTLYWTTLQFRKEKGLPFRLQNCNRLAHVFAIS